MAQRSQHALIRACLQSDKGPGVARVAFFMATVKSPSIAYSIVASLTPFLMSIAQDTRHLHRTR